MLDSLQDEFVVLGQVEDAPGGARVAQLPHWLVADGHLKVGIRFEIDIQVNPTLNFQDDPILNFFCGNGLPLARARWVQSTFSCHCPLSFDQRR